MDHGPAEKFQDHDPGVLQSGVQNELGLNDDAVNPFFLHAGQTSQGLVRHIFAQARSAQFVPLQRDHLAHASGNIPHFKHGGFLCHDLMPGMVHAHNIDDFSCRRDHAKREQVVNGRAVLETQGTAGVFRYVPADG